MAFLDFLAQPLSWNLCPHFFAHPGSFLVTDPPRLARENKHRIASEWDQHVYVAVHDLKTRRVSHGALKARILISANDQRIDLLSLHGGANVPIAPVDFVWCGHDRRIPPVSARRKFPRPQAHKSSLYSQAFRWRLSRLRHRAVRWMGRS